MSSKQWTVGYFEKENQYSVIPDTWIISCGNMTISRWPKSGNVKEMISEHVEVCYDWPTYPVKIVSQYYNTYKEASIKERQLFYSASSSEPEFMSNQKNKLVKQKRTYESLHDDSDSSCNSGSLTPIKVKKYTENKIVTQTILEEEAVTRPTNRFSPDHVPPQPHTEMFQTITSALNNVYNLHYEQNAPRQELLSLETNSTIALDQSEKENNNDNHQIGSNNLIQSMFEQITTILAYVKRIDKKIETVGCNRCNAESANPFVNNDFLNLFPIKTVEEIQNIEIKLMDTTFEKQMINLVSQIGGLNVHNFIKRVYARLYTNELATQYSWTGFRNNNPLQHLKLTKIIKDLCMKTFKGTEMEFEINVKNWFKNGSLRQSREKK